MFTWCVNYVFTESGNSNGSFFYIDAATLEVAKAIAEKWLHRSITAKTRIVSITKVGD